MSVPEQPVQADQLFPDDEPATPEEEFDALERELAEFPEDATEFDATEPPPPLGKSYEFNFTEESFVMGSGRSPNGTYGLQTLTGWIDKCLHTDRGAHPACPEDFGVPNPFEIIGHPRDTTAVGSYEGRVREGLLGHPRIESVDNFSVTTDPDQEVIRVSFTVGLDDETEVTVEVEIP